MAELPFLDAVTTYLSGAGLSPAPASIGVAEPGAAADLPSVTLSLEGCARERTGIGKKRANERKTGILPRTATIDLESATLADDPSFSLIDEARKILILPHGGLVRADGTEGSLLAADLTVTVDAGGPPSTPTVVAGPTPAAGQVSASASDGVLAFGAALPPSGTVTVTYFLGAWEQELIRIHGTLRIDVCAAAAAQAHAVSDQVATALLADRARGAIRRLYEIHLSAVSSIAPFALTSTVNASRRSARFGFLYEHEINTPDSSGRVIKTIPVKSEFFPPEDGPA